MTVPNSHEDHNLNPRWVMGLRDLRGATAPARYRITMPDGDCTEVTVSGRKRQVLSALSEGPIFCASTVRLGDAVFRLKQDHGIAPETKSTIEGRKFYALDAVVERIGGAG